jgi:hypothetical protein
MTAQSYPSATARPDKAGLSPLRCALTGVAVLLVTFVLCWGAAAAGLTGGSHAFVALFTTAPVGSATALAIGVSWSVVIGGVTGALGAVVYNALAFVESR